VATTAMLALLAEKQRYLKLDACLKYGAFTLLNFM
jgi:hypothetical protein